MPPASAEAASGCGGSGSGSGSGYRLRLLLLALGLAAVTGGSLSCPPRYFACASGGQCVHEDALCDTRPDCDDASDESATVCSGRSCKPHQVACLSPGHCVSLRRRCDGFPDCARSNSSDDSDEADCGVGRRRRPTCGVAQFACGGEAPSCIEDEFVCDSYVDCSDGSDEAKCNRDCSSSQYKCDDGGCVDARLRCDGKIDCAKGDDEVACSAGADRRCQFTAEFYCRLSGQCISQVFLCDGHDDCEHAEDEVCSVRNKQCGSDKYWTCKSGSHCVPLSARCDGLVHCPDASDELDCPRRSKPQRPCPADKHHCNGTFGHCVDISGVCFGRESCPHPDATVEEECRLLREAQNPCAGNNGGCEQSCSARLRDAELLPHCSCRSGFGVDPSNSSRCVDEDECQRFGACSQLCSNSVGSFSCSCRRGYSLHGNSCRANQPPTLLLSTSSSVQLLQPDGRRTVVRDGLHFPTFLTPDVRGRRLFFFGRDGSVWETPFDGGHLRRVARNLLVDGLAFDWTRGLLFYSSPGLRGADGFVGAVNVTSGRRVTLRRLRCPRGLVVQPQLGLLFVAEACGPRPGVYSLRLDGARKRLLVSGAGSPLQLALDTEQRPWRLYWSDPRRASLLSCDLNGTDLRAHWRGGSPHSLSVFEDRLYWTDPDDDRLRSVRKFAAEDLRREAAAPGLLAATVAHPLLQPPLPAAPGCDCGHVCVALRPGGRPACFCDRSHRLQPDTGECVPKEPTESVVSLRSRHSDRLAGVGTVSGIVTAALSGCVLLCAMLAVAWRLRQRRRRRSQTPGQCGNESFGYFTKAPPYCRMNSDERHSEVYPEDCKH